jgi:hypothetical protein
LNKLEKIKDASLRSRLQDAHGSLRSNKPTDAVKTVSEVFLELLRMDPAMMDATVQVRGRQMPIIMRWPMLGANLVPDSVKEREPRIEFIRDHFAMSEAITYYEFTVDTAIERGL